MRTKEEVLQGMSMIEFITRCKVDFKFFCERLLNLNDFGGIHDFQLEWFTLAQNNDAVIIEAPSGFSKTEVMGVAYPLWYAFNNPKVSILLISKTISQAKDNLLQRIKNYIEENDILLELKPKGENAVWNVKQVTLANGTTIVNVPYNINVKGYRAHLIILDELDSYEDKEIYFDHVVSRIHPGGKIIGITTPEGPTKLVGEIKARNPKGYVFKKTVAIVDKYNKPLTKDFETGKSIWEEKYPINWLMQQFSIMGKYKWLKNYMCETLSDMEGAIFSVESFVNSYDYRIKFNQVINPDAQYFIGVDLATSKGDRADFDAYVVVEKLDDFITIKHIETHKGWLIPKKINRLVELASIFKSNKTTKFIVDVSNVGRDVVSQIRLNGLTVVEQAFYSVERKMLLRQYANIIESRRLIVPRSQTDPNTIALTNELLEQMIGFKKKDSEAGNETIFSTAKHDDIVMATAMAVKEASRMKNMGCVGVSR